MSQNENTIIALHQSQLDINHAVETSRSRYRGGRRHRCRRFGVREDLLLIQVVFTKKVQMKRSVTGDYADGCCPQRKSLTLRALFIFMMAKKKKLIIIAVLVISFVTSYILCGTEQNDSGIDSIKLEEYTAVLGNRVSLDSIYGTYNGVLPPNLKQHSHKMLMVLIFGHGHSKKSRTSKKNQEELSKCLTVIY